MSKSWLTFFSLLYFVLVAIFQLFQLVIFGLMSLIIKPVSIISTLIFIVASLVACVLYFITVKFLVKQIRRKFKSLDLFLIKIEKFDEEFQRKNKNY